MARPLHYHAAGPHAGCHWNEMAQTDRSTYVEGKLLVIWGIKVVCRDDHWAQFTY